MMNARSMEAEHGLGGCWMMNGRKIGRSSHTLELEELGGFWEGGGVLKTPPSTIGRTLQNLDLNNFAKV